jgi:hypothetical protein
MTVMVTSYCWDGQSAVLQCVTGGGFDGLRDTAAGQCDQHKQNT